MIVPLPQDGIVRLQRIFIQKFSVSAQSRDVGGRGRGGGFWFMGKFVLVVSSD